jgi:hypothetical protein
MDITAVIGFLSHIVSKNPVILANETLSSCEQKLNEDINNKIFIISNNCFERFKKLPDAPQGANKTLLAVGHNNIVIIKQEQDKTNPSLSIIGGNNTQISHIDFVYPLAESEFLVLKNKNENKLLIFSYKTPGNVNPIKVLQMSSVFDINKIDYDKKLKKMTVFGMNGTKEYLIFDEKSAI